MSTSIPSQTEVTGRLEELHREKNRARSVLEDSTGQRSEQERKAAIETIRTSVVPQLQQIADGLWPGVDAAQVREVLLTFTTLTSR